MRFSTVASGRICARQRRGLSAAHRQRRVARVSLCMATQITAAPPKRVRSRPLHPSSRLSSPGHGSGCDICCACGAVTRKAALDTRLHLRRADAGLGSDALAATAGAAIAGAVIGLSDSLHHTRWERLPSWLWRSRFRGPPSTARAGLQSRPLCWSQGRRSSPTCSPVATRRRANMGAARRGSVGWPRCWSRRRPSGPLLGGGCWRSASRRAVRCWGSRWLRCWRPAASSRGPRDPARRRPRASSPTPTCSTGESSSGGGARRCRRSPRPRLGRRPTICRSSSGPTRRGRVVGGARPLRRHVGRAVACLPFLGALAGRSRRGPVHARQPR